MGYRRLNDKLRHDEDISVVNDKMDPPYLQKNSIRSNLKSRYNGCYQTSNNPAFIARKQFLIENLRRNTLMRNGLPMMTEFKYAKYLRQCA
ncbi:MAG: hypothetical protein ACLVIY_02375 [Anaerobutyricum soehngenii]